MDVSAVNVNVTVDDFDSIISYANSSVWKTPDPSSPTFIANDSPWWMGTFHQTDVVNATLTFNFTGPAIYVFGDSGPSYGSYEVQVDGAISTHSAYSAAINVTVPHLLYRANNLSYDAHTLLLRNVGMLEQGMGMLVETAFYLTFYGLPYSWHLLVLPCQTLHYKRQILPSNIMGPGVTTNLRTSAGAGLRSQMKTKQEYRSLSMVPRSTSLATRKMIMDCMQ